MEVVDEGTSRLPYKVLYRDQRPALPLNMQHNASDVREQRRLELEHPNENNVVR